ncbi:MAG: peptide chain release factor 1 [Candidatus Coatesbacteria bacterium]|nr:peptide chain release factor 1 [Candidatus Coatesbacteria bacterium]
MEEKLSKLEARFNEINIQLSDPLILKDQKQVQVLSKERSRLHPIIELYKEYKKNKKGLEDSEEMLKDSELRDLAEEEISRIKHRQEELNEEIKYALLPKDPNDDRNTIVEIRGGTGGAEANLFASDLFKMYKKFAEIKGWKIEVLDLHETDLGGLKEAIFSIQGKGAYSLLKFESGIHRVQRIPVTESSGRIHTSAVTVAVLPEAEEVDIEIDPEELRIDIFRSTGPGGQSVNTTDSAVRITHIPSGIVVSIQDEKSQHKNKAKALKILRSRLLELKQREAEEERASSRRSQVGRGDRSEKIRTYNFPQSRVTDHRINFSLYKLDAVLNGDLQEIIDKLIIADRAERLAIATEIS